MIFGVKMNLWILTEERPSNSTLKIILNDIIKKDGYDINVDEKNFNIIPIIKNNKFENEYLVSGIVSKHFKKCIIKIIEGESSFVDYLIFIQNDEPDKNSKPYYAIEETKSNTQETRNLTLQRISKFPSIKKHYPDINCYMYWREIESILMSKETTSNLAIKLLRTIDVTILGCDYTSLNDEYKPFKDLDDFIDYIKKRPNPKSGDKYDLKKENGSLILSAKMDKSKFGIININKIKYSLYYPKGEHYPKIQNVTGPTNKNNYVGKITSDPSIGVMSGYIAALRALEIQNNLEAHKVVIRPTRPIFVLGKKNKFIDIMQDFSISFEKSEYDSQTRKISKKIIDFEKKENNKNYWKYSNGEKIVSIFLDIVIEKLDNIKKIFANHAGTEKEFLQIPPIKNANPRSIVDLKKSGGLPDIIFFDKLNNIVYMVEAEQSKNINDGIKQLGKWKKNEKLIKKYYNGAIIKKFLIHKGYRLHNHLVLFGLDDEGKIILYDNIPEFIIEAISKNKELFNPYKEQ